ncbi:MAG: beta-aspartyl-peptidase [Synergistaceae bacterium]|jgi:beta-aspartyl-dipeptidase (metallo-type)|nr:beta-aspartyl-peptidase [Synergistaceae bacterium]
MLWIKNGDVYAPKALGLHDILVSEGKTAGLFPPETLTAEQLGKIDPDFLTLEADGCPVIPGIIDRHVHFNGAGGEGGPMYRTPPLQLSSFIRAGVTSAVGMLGTDGTCRSLRELLMKARGLEAEGISTWILTGSYGIPSATLTGGVMSDICLIDKVIGLKMALSDHRGSHPSADEIRRAVSDARTGGMLAGKSGLVCVHMGTEATAYGPLLEALEKTDVPLSQFAPTHVSRCEALLKDSVGYGKRGGYLDITAESDDNLDDKPDDTPRCEPSTRDAIRFLLAAGVPSRRITLSSDGNGSMPRFDERGNFAGMGIGGIDAVLWTILSLWDENRETILAMGTSNVAEHLGLKGKGCIGKDADADILVLAKSGGRPAWKLRHVVARGQVMMKDEIVVKNGTFEE